MCPNGRAKVWVALKETIIGLYADHDLATVRDIVAEQYGFYPSRSAYQNHLLKWDIRKYRPRSRLAPRKNGKSVPYKKVRQEIILEVPPEWLPQEPEGLPRQESEANRRTCEESSTKEQLPGGQDILHPEQQAQPPSGAPCSSTSSQEIDYDLEEEEIFGKRDDSYYYSLPLSPLASGPDPQAPLPPPARANTRIPRKKRKQTNSDALDAIVNNNTFINNNMASPPRTSATTLVTPPSDYEFLEAAATTTASPWQTQHGTSHLEEENGVYEAPVEYVSSTLLPPEGASPLNFLLEDTTTTITNTHGYNHYNT